MSSKRRASRCARSYEQVFRHREFTGRSGGMFGYEGLGCIYWHMVVEAAARGAGELSSRRSTPMRSAAICQRLGGLYYRVREGIGFNKTPAEYGAFPTDPYSHTPGHGGAQQPGMTGQVKEEILSRFGELGVRVGQRRGPLRASAAARARILARGPPDSASSTSTANGRS